MSERHPSESRSPEPLGPQHFPSPFVKTTLRRGQRLRWTNYSTTILRPSALRLSYHPPRRSLSLSPLVPFRYLPTRLQSLILPLPYLEPTTYTITRSLSDSSLSHFTLLAPFTLLISLFSLLSPSNSTASFLLVCSATVCISPCLFSLSLHFIARSLVILSLSCSPILLPALSLLHHHSLLARCRLTRALILPYPLPRP